MLLGGSLRFTSTFWDFSKLIIFFISVETAISFLPTSPSTVSTGVDICLGYFEKVLIEILSFVCIPILSAVSLFNIAAGIPAVHFRNLTFSFIFTSNNKKPQSYFYIYLLSRRLYWRIMYPFFPI